MTNKQIIIDGIDVSKCGHYHYGKCEIDYDEWNNEIIRYNECQNNPNCYFKQLKAKEQECKELKEDRERWKSNFNGKVSAIEELLQQLDQFKQILAKIKEICNNNDELQGDFNLIDCDKYKLGKHNLANKILQKISEAEDDRN